VKPAGIGGAIVGLAIGAMHYIGMAAVNAHGYIVWDRGFVAASIILGTLFAAAATQAAFSLRGLWRIHASWVLLALGICSLHFTGMSAMSISVDPSVEVSASALDSFVLAIAIAAVSLLIVILAYAGIAMDRHLSHRAVQEARRLRAYVTELEATKRQLETTSSELLVALKTASAADHAKSQFLATMSHELRTPLNAIIGFSEIMRQQMFGPLGTERYVEYTNDIHDSGRHLLNVIDDILDISKIEAGRYAIEEDEIDFANVLRWSIEMMRARTIEKQQTVTLALPDEMPSLHADQRAMRQVMLNLLSNASKFTPDGGKIELSVAIDGQGDLRLTVADNGIGIPADKLHEVLEPFGQVDDTSARQHGGTGLGLPITKSLIEMHGGGFMLQSEFGHGTTATMTLPGWRLVWNDTNAKAATPGA
jgi:signal transduction histidine kinase